MNYDPWASGWVIIHVSEYSVYVYLKQLMVQYVINFNIFNLSMYIKLWQWWYMISYIFIRSIDILWMSHVQHTSKCLMLDNPHCGLIDIAYLWIRTIPNLRFHFKSRRSKSKFSLAVGFIWTYYSQYSPLVAGTHVYNLHTSLWQIGGCTSAASVFNIDYIFTHNWSRF